LKKFKKYYHLNVNEDSEEDSWLMTYADTITNLLGFFALVLSFSAINSNTFSMFTDNIKNSSTKNSVSQEINKLKSEIENILTDDLISKNFTLNFEDGAICISGNSTTFFHSGNAKLTVESKEKLLEIIKKLKLLKFKYNVEIEGHSDGQPIFNSEYKTNWELSSARANNVLNFFMENGIQPEIMKSTSFGDTKPLMPNYNKDGTINLKNMATNRRIVVKIFYVSSK
jgi:chemotaxis protein MotB